MLWLLKTIFSPTSLINWPDAYRVVTRVEARCFHAPETDLLERLASSSNRRRTLRMLTSCALSMGRRPLCAATNCPFSSSTTPRKWIPRPRLRATWNSCGLSSSTPASWVPVLTGSMTKAQTLTNGIYLPPADLHWSLFGAPEQLEDHAKEECYWELQKFLIMALKANPNILECLHTPLVEHADGLAEELLSMRRLSLQAYLQDLQRLRAQPVQEARTRPPHQGRD